MPRRNRRPRNGDHSGRFTHRIEPHLFVGVPGGNICAACLLPRSRTDVHGGERPGVRT